MGSFTPTPWARLLFGFSLTNNASQICVLASFRWPAFQDICCRWRDEGKHWKDLSPKSSLLPEWVLPWVCEHTVESLSGDFPEDFLHRALVWRLLLLYWHLSCVIALGPCHLGKQDTKVAFEKSLIVCPQNWKVQEGAGNRQSSTAICLWVANSPWSQPFLYILR